MKENIKSVCKYIWFVSLIKASHAYLEAQTPQNNTSIYAIEGKSFSLNCMTLCPKNNKIKLSWEYLGHAAKNISEIRASIQNCVESNNSINITIYNASKEDEGEYNCVSVTNTGICSTLNISKVYVGKPILTIETTERLSMPAGTVQISVRRSFTVKDYPPINNWYLLKDGKALLESFLKKKVEIKKKIRITDEGPITSFSVIINSLEVNDTANYTIVLSNGYLTKNITYEIRRKGISTVNIIEDYKKRYQVGDIITLKCVIVGYPPMAANWFFSDINGIDSVKKEFVITSLIKAVSSIQFKLLNSNSVTCQAKNKNDTKILLAYEIKNGFGIDEADRSWYPEGYNISIPCLASRYDFKTLFWSRKNNEELVTMTNLSGRNLSLVATLQISNSSVTQSGLYQCFGTRLNGSLEVRSIPIKIAGMKSPQIKDMNEDNVIYLVVFQPLRLSCYANAVPEPHIEWLKDNSTLRNDSYVEIHERISNWSEVNSILIIKQVLDKDFGTYTCRATNRNGKVMKLYNVILKDSAFHTMLLAATAPIIVILSIFVLYLIRLVRKEKQVQEELKAAGLYLFEKGNPECLNPDLFIDDQAELLPYDSSFEFPRKDLILGEQLGSGAYGVVYKAMVSARTSKTSTVAAKVAKKTIDNICIKALISELKIMMHLGKHVNIVNLIGACTKNLTRRELIVIVEYCEFGNIRNYMIKHRKTFINQLTTYKEIPTRRYRSISCSSGSSGIQSVDLNSYEDQFTEYTTLTNSENTRGTFDRQDSAYDSDGSFHEQSHRPLSSRDLLCWAFQIARGMEYLASRKVLHGDLAARNILLAEGNIVKICDFGLSRSLYKNEEYMKKSESPLPFKWLAVECMLDKIFSIQSDVWSFGIVLWEIFALGKTPYPSIGVESIIKWLLQGNRLEKPPFADNRLYRIMLNCWELAPSSRPSFTQLQQELGNFLEHNVRNYYTELNDAYVELNKMRLGQLDYLDMVCVPDYNNIVTPGSHHYINEVLTQRKPPESENNDEHTQLQLSPRLQEYKFDFDIKRLEAIYETNSQDGELTPMVTADNLPTRPDSESEYERSLSPCTVLHGNEYLDEVFEHKDNSISLENNLVNNPTYLIYNMCSEVDTQNKVIDYTNVNNCKPSQHSVKNSFTPKFILSDHA